MTSIMTNILKPLETSSSLGMFARDTGGCLLSRLILSRSKDEAREIGFCELTESAVFYFGAPFLAKATKDIFLKKDNLSNDKIQNIKNIKISKLSRILSVFSLILPLIYSIAPIRNKITDSKTGKEKFIEVIELEKNNKKEKKQKKPLYDYIKKMITASIVLLAVSLGFSNTLLKNQKIYDKLEPIIDKIIKNFDFTSTGDLKTIHYGALIYPISILGYLKASRDKYERNENIRRFSTTVPLLFFGEKLIQNPIYKRADKIFKTNVFNNGDIKSYKDILSMPEGLKAQFLKSKNLAYGLTFFINTMAIAFAIGLLNRIKTKKNFEKENKQTFLGGNQWTKKSTSNLVLQNSILKEQKDAGPWKPFFANQKPMNS